MKKLLFLLFIATFFNSFAQSDEGMIHYKMEFPDDGTKMSRKTKGSGMTVLYTEKKIRVDIKVSKLMTINTILNQEEKPEMIVLTSIKRVGKKYLSYDNFDDYKPEKDTTKQEKREVKVVDEFKKIAGYKCQKVIITSDDKTKAIYWCMIDKKINKNLFKIMQVEETLGMPLEFSTINKKGEVGPKFTATKVKFTLPKSAKKGKWFSTEIPKGYSELSGDLEKLGI